MQNGYLDNSQIHPEKIIGNTSKMKKLSSLIDRVSQHDAPVLITGESGVGKELAAKTLHCQNSRSSYPFISVSCNFPQSLIDIELFGYVQGAFSGAAGPKKGCLESADKGTVFFDEISRVSPETQMKLLKFLEHKEMKRLGGCKPIQLDVRVIAATSHNLKEEAADGAFRKDLYNRLHPITLAIPPLRSRKKDITSIAEFYLEEFSRQTGKKVKKISRSARDVLTAYDWPSNVRELKNIIERAVLLCEGDTLYPGDFPEEICMEP